MSLTNWENYLERVQLKKAEEQSLVEMQQLEEQMLNEAKENKKKSDDVPTIRCMYTGKKVVPSTFEVARYMGKVLPLNERAMRTFIRELKENSDGGFGALIKELCTHGETYNQMVEQIANPDTHVARKLTKTMYENHKKFMDEMQEMLQLEAVDAPIDKRMSVDDEEDEADIDSDDTEVSHKDEPDEDPDDMLNMDDSGEEMSEPEVDPETDLKMGSEDEPAPDFDPEAEPTDELEPAADPEAELEPEPEADPELDKKAMENKFSKMPMKIKKEFAYHQMLKEMRKFDPMMQAMREMMEIQ